MMNCMFQRVGVANFFYLSAAVSLPGAPESEVWVERSQRSKLLTKLGRVKAC